MSIAPVSPRTARSAAQAWFEEHLPELNRRAFRCFRHWPPTEREEAVAEVLASAFKYTLRAELRGKLSQLTACTLVSFFSRLYCQGRRMAGYSRNDALFEPARRGKFPRTVSLNDHLGTRRGAPSRLSVAEMLADSRGDRPAENARQNIDYPEILRRGRVSSKAGRTFHYFCETAGQGQQKELAREMGVAESRVTQLKAELADCLAAAGYAPAGAIRPAQRETRRRRPADDRRLQAIPLNPATNPRSVALVHV